MKPRICRCCGEPMSEGANALSRNPNVCASCSSMADGMDQSSLPSEGESLTEGVRVETQDSENAVAADPPAVTATC